MIYDFVPWKEHLLAVVKDLERRKRQRRWSERSMFLVERDVMMSAYAVRKLLEARKVSDDLAAKEWRLERHELLGVIPDHYNMDRIDELFDLTHSSPECLDTAALCNQIIHSWIWVPVFAEAGGFDGFYVASDRRRKKCLYFVPVDVLVELFQTVGSEDVYGIAMRRNDKGEMEIMSVWGRKYGDGGEPEDEHPWRGVAAPLDLN